MQEDINEIKVMLAEMQKDLKYHIKRTDLLEAQVKPVVEHVSFVHRLSKLVITGLGIAAAIAAIYGVIK